MSTLDEFLATGHLGEIVTGMSKEDVRRVLGDPLDVSVKKNPEIWKYGALQLTFYRDSQEDHSSLVLIGLHFAQDNHRLPAPVTLTDWSSKAEMGPEDFRKRLLEVGIPVHSDVSSSDAEHLVLSSAVRVTFSEGRLHSIQYSSEKKSDLKQLSISVPVSDLELIRKEAAARKMSVTALCSQWIREQVERYQKVGAP